MRDQNTRLPTLILCLLLSVYSLSGQYKKPNILITLTDNQAPCALGISGDPNASTPNMDRIAKEGTCLQNFFVTKPVCSPSRTSILTGRYASEYGILDFIHHPRHRLYDQDCTPGLETPRITFAEVLQEAGYSTGLVGKWHLGDWILREYRKYHSTNHGFDYFMGLTGGGSVPDDPELEKNGNVHKSQSLTTDILTEEGMELKIMNADESFLLCLNPRTPHARWLPVADEDWSPVKNMDPHLPYSGHPDLNIEKVKKEMVEYLASTRGIDPNLGRILALFDELGLTEKTIIIFISTHRYNMGHNGIKHNGTGIWMTKSILGDTENICGKYHLNLCDNSLKVPALVYWKGVIKPNMVIRCTITSLDIYPCFVYMAGAESPDLLEGRGRSFVPLLDGEEINGRNAQF